MAELSDEQVFGTQNELSDADVFGTNTAPPVATAPKELSDADVFNSPVSTPSPDDTTSAAGAVARNAAESVIPAYAAGKGAEILSKGARALLFAKRGFTGGEIAGGGPEDPVADVLGIGAGIVGGLIGYLTADKAQSAAIKEVAPGVSDELEKYKQEDAAQHPLASFAGNLIGGVPAFEVNNPLVAAKGAAAMYKIARGATVDATEKQAAKNLATQIGFGAGVGVVNPLLQGQAPTIPDITQSIAQMLLFGEPRKLGKTAEPSTPPPNDNNPETQEAPPQEAEQPLPPPVPPEEAQNVGVVGTPEVDYQYASPESKAWWEKHDELQANVDAAEPGTPEFRAARNAREAHSDLAYTPEGRQAGLLSPRIDKNAPLTLVNATASIYDSIGQLNLTGWKFAGGWESTDEGKQFRRVVNPDGTKRAVVWKDTLHPLQETALEQNGGSNALQIRSSTPPNVGETPGDSSEVVGRIPAPKETALPQEIQKAQAPPVVAPQVIPPEAVQSLRAKLFVNMQGRTMNISPDAFPTADPHLKLVLGQDAPSWKALADAGVVKAEPNPDGTVAVKVNLESPLNPGGAAADLPPALKFISDQNNSREAFARAQAEADAKKVAAQPPIRIFHGGPSDALDRNWPKWWTTNPERASAYGKGSVHEATVTPKNPFYSKVTLSQEQTESILEKGHDAIIIGSKENPIDVILRDSNGLTEVKTPSQRIPGVTLDTTDHVGEGKLFESPEHFEKDYTAHADAEVRESRDEFLKRTVCASRIKMKISE
jgi:hypothetical protein